MGSRKPDYGVDAPGLVRIFVMTGAVFVLLLAATVSLQRVWWPWSLIVSGVLALVVVYAWGMAGLMMSWSKVTKVRERDRMLDLIAWRGDEQVLDVGCGRGLMMIGAALRLVDGHAIGIDIWQASDQSGNTSDGAVANAVIAGVSRRVEVRTADMRALPFPAASFDVVLSHWAVHNLAVPADRALALAEMTRVLRPGGILLLADIGHRHTYAEQLAQHGLTEQRMLVGPVRDAILKAVSFDSFRPFWLLACRQR